MEPFDPDRPTQPAETPPGGSDLEPEEPTIQFGAQEPVELPGQEPAEPAAPRRPAGRIALALGVAVALVAGALAFVFTRGGGEALAMQFREGDSYRYRLSLAFDGTVEVGTDVEPFQFEMEETFSMVVESVDQDGIATLHMTIEDLSASVGGDSVSAPTDDLDFRLKIAPDGRILESGGLGFATGPNTGPGFPGVDQFTPLLPEGPVSPGDTWASDFEQSVPFFDKPFRFEGESELLRYESVAGVDTAVIRSRLTIPLDFSLNLREVLGAIGEDDSDLPEGTDPVFVYGGNVELVQTNWFDPEQGEVVESSSDAAIDMTLRIEGVPEEELDGVDEIAVRGDMTMELQRLAA